MATYKITVAQFRDILSQVAEDYILSDGENTPPTGGSVEVSVDPNNSNTIQLESFHNLVERVSDIIQSHFTPQ